MRARVALSMIMAIAASAAVAHPTDPAAAVRDVLLQNVAAFERGDYAATERLWAHGDEVSVFESGHANYGWADYRDHHLKPELTEMKNVHYRLDDIRPRIRGSMAWATFKYSITADYEGRKIDGTGIGTAVMEKSGGAWKIVHWHTSAPRKKP